MQREINYQWFKQDRERLERYPDSIQTAAFVRDRAHDGRLIDAIFLTANADAEAVSVRVIDCNAVAVVYERTHDGKWSPYVTVIQLGPDEQVVIRPRVAVACKVQAPKACGFCGRSDLVKVPNAIEWRCVSCCGRHSWS